MKKILRLMYLEWRELAMPVAIGIICSLAAWLICFLYSGKIDSDAILNHSTLIFLTGCGIPLIWAIILFSSFIPPKNIYPFLSAMPIPIALIFWNRFIIRFVFLLGVSNIYWLAVSFSQYWVESLFLVYIGIILVVVALIAGSLIKTVKLNLFLIFPMVVIIIVCQLPLPVFFAFLTQRNYLLGAAFQFAFLLIIVIYLSWRKFCLNQKTMRTVLLWCIIIAVLPWLELGASAFYWWSQNHQTRIRAEAMGFLIIPESITKDILSTPYWQNQKQWEIACEKAIDYILSKSNYQPDAPPYLTHLNIFRFDLKYYFEIKLMSLYLADNQNDFMETLRLSWYVNEFDDGIFKQIARRKNIKSEWFDELLKMIQEYQKLPLPDKAVISLDKHCYSSIHYDYLAISKLYNPEHYESNISGLRKITGMLGKPLKWRVETKMFNNAMNFLKTRSPHQAQRPYSQMISRKLFLAAALLKVRLYENQHGTFPDSWEFPSGYYYQKDIDGFKIYTRNKTLTFRYLGKK